MLDQKEIENINKAKNLLKKIDDHFKQLPGFAASHIESLLQYVANYHYKELIDNPSPHTLVDILSKHVSSSLDARCDDDPSKIAYKLVYKYTKKLATGIISEALRQKMEFIVVGKNKLWKQELNLGSTTNRKGYNLPHAKLIEVLRYKALLKGIVVLETEESYTSKTSFVTNEELKQYAPETDGKSNNSQLEGKRVGHVFKIGKKRYHADINGAFNIIRKVFKQFVYNPLQLSLTYVLSEVKMYGKQYFYDFNRKLYGVLATPSLA